MKNNNKILTRIEKRYTFSPENAEKNKGFRTAVLRASGETSGDSRTIRGYGVVFGQKSKIITEWVQDKGFRTFNEIIDPGAFDSILNNGFDVVLSVNHYFDEILARTASETLVITKDDKGLVYETELPRTARGEDVLQMVLRGDYYESSFQFIIAENGDEWQLDQETNIWTRTIKKIETLIDLTIATYRGAYSNTDIQINDVKRTAFNEYDEQDIAVAKRKLNELYNAGSVDMPEKACYLAELELDGDKNQNPWMKTGRKLKTGVFISK